MADSDKLSLEGVRVQIVDDSKTIRRTAESILVKVGCVVEMSIDGFHALSQIPDFKPDILFIDVMMPRLDGFQTCSLIKRNPDLKSIPVVMLSSKDGIFDVAKGKICGSDQYLTKPFDKDELISAINKFVKQ